MDQVSTDRARILSRLAELLIEERAEFAKQDLRASELGIPNEGWAQTAWIREERGPLVRALRELGASEHPIVVGATWRERGDHLAHHVEVETLHADGCGVSLYKPTTGWRFAMSLVGFRHQYEWLNDPQGDTAEALAARPIVAGDAVHCDFGEHGGIVRCTVLRVDGSQIPYLVEYETTEVVRRQTWADARSTKLAPPCVDDSDTLEERAAVVGQAALAAVRAGVDRVVLVEVQPYYCGACKLRMTRAEARAHDCHEFNGDGGHLELTATGVRGWSVFSGCEGECPRFVGFFQRNEDAVLLTNAPDPDSEDGQVYPLDGNNSIELSVLTRHGVVTANDYTITTHEQLEERITQAQKEGNPQ